MKIFLTAVILLLALGGVGACVHSAVYTSNVEDRYPPIGRMFDVNGKLVHVIEAGEASAPPVLMIHGASANAREFTFTLAPRLKDNFHVLMADRPGHGYSGRPERSETLEVQAAQMAGVVRQLAPDQKAVIVGHSYGGAVALRLALDNPDLVSGVVLLAPVTHDWGGGGESWYNKIAGPPVIGPIFSQLVPLVAPSMVKSGIDGVFDPKDAPDGYYSDAAIGLLFRPPSFRANADDMNVLQEELAAQQDRYPELNMPVVLFSGARDTVIDPKLHAGKIKHQVSDFELVALPDTGHMPHHDHGGEIADVIRRLAAGNDADQSS